MPAAKGIGRDLKRALKAASDALTVKEHSGLDPIYEYTCGYHDALVNVWDALNGTPPTQSRFWPKEKK